MFDRAKEGDKASIVMLIVVAFSVAALVYGLVHSHYERRHETLAGHSIHPVHVALPGARPPYQSVSNDGRRVLAAQSDIDYLEGIREGRH